MTNLMEKEKYLDFIKSFSDITITQACREVGVSKSSVYALEISLEKLKMLKQNIDFKVKKLYEDNNDKTSSTL